MGFNMLAVGLEQIKRKTETAGTDIISVIPSMAFAKSVITRLSVKATTTAQTLSVMNVLGKTELTHVAAKDQAVIKVKANPGTKIAEHAYLGIVVNGVYTILKVLSVDELNVTLTANLSHALAVGDKVDVYGIVTNHEQHACPDGTTTFEAALGFFVADDVGKPIVLHLSNGTNAAVIMGGTVVYTTV